MYQDVENLMDAAYRSYEDSGKAPRAKEEQAKVLLMDSIAASLIAANEISLMKLDLMNPTTTFTEVDNKPFITTIDGKKIEV